MTGWGTIDGWDIDPIGVQTVLEKVITHYAGEDGKGNGGLVKQAGQFAQYVDDAVAAALSEPIGIALGEYAKAVKPELKATFHKVHSCVKGATDATKAYIDGDIKMAEKAQKRAVDAPSPQAGGKW
ncbi:DUF6507 family protein [Actinomadura montaniterrae]|uniref:Uncharacterized protein n=1 Tax=Actinomadura montaniterrae TaxID=1803903 RepID=A0A6L3WA72_9ACTN|nr:DUF6507 family protein [Actinomadura montaniterrae]KAB2388800.1 hypothetical protein F9B16_02440 [Actinomadura montaniterrae]